MNSQLTLKCTIPCFLLKQPKNKQATVKEFWCGPFSIYVEKCSSNYLGYNYYNNSYNNYIYHSVLFKCLGKNAWAALVTKKNKKSETSAKALLQSDLALWLKPLHSTLSASNQNWRVLFPAKTHTQREEWKECVCVCQWEERECGMPIL